MDLKEIRQIIEMMKRNDLSLFHLEREGFKIKLRKGVDFDTMVDKIGSSGNVMMGPSHAASPATHSYLPPDSSPSGDGGESEVGEPSSPAGTAKILSPMVGTFYRAAGPGEKVFANIGDTITEGSTVCIIEAMKVMNEIKAEASGVITRILVDDATPVQFETPLFEIKPG